MCGPGEWLIEKHGTKKRRSWRKLLLGMDAESGRIVAATLTDRDGDDAAQVGPLLDQIDEPVGVLTGDGADDRTGVYASFHQAGAKPAETVHLSANGFAKNPQPFPAERAVNCLSRAAN